MRVIDPTTIKLCLTYAEAATASSRSSRRRGECDTGTINCRQWVHQQRGGDLSRSDEATFLGTAVDTSNGEIVIGPSQTGDDFQNNEQVVYSVGPQTPGASTTALGGLSPGATYYVYRVDANTISCRPR